MARFQVEDRVLFDYKERVEILKKTGGKCAHCGRGLNVRDKNCTVEHMIPLSKGGFNSMANLLPLCNNI